VRTKGTISSEGGLVALDMTGATESNTGQKGGNTSLGLVSRIEVAAVHGRPDSSLDAYQAAVAVPDRPASGVVGIRVRMKVATPDPAPAIGTNAGLYLYVGNTAALTSNTAYLCGLQLQASPSIRYRALGISKAGSVPAGTTIIDLASNAGTLYVDMAVYFEKAGPPDSVASRVWGEGGSTDGEKTYVLSNTLVAGADIYVGFCCDQGGATPGDVLDMQDVTFSYQWMS